MNREELEAYILNHYSTEPDYPWADTPRAAVFRHVAITVYPFTHSRKRVNRY